MITTAFDYPWSIQRDTGRSHDWDESGQCLVCGASDGEWPVTGCRNY